MPVVVNPADAGNFRVLIDQIQGGVGKVNRCQLVIADVPRQSQHLFLLFQQVESHFLVGELQITLHTFLLTVHFLDTQITHAADDRHQKNGNRCNRGQQGKAILAAGT